ncbi:hypothetical protein Tco_0915898 [Tanacetum coccineum]
MTESYRFKSARFKRLKRWILVQKTKTAVGLYQLKGMIKAQRIKEAHIGMKATDPERKTVSYHNVSKADQRAAEPNDERVLLASLIANLKLDIDENKKIQKQLKKANTSLTQELKKSKQDLKKSKQDLFYCKSELAKYTIFQTNHKDKEKVELKCAKGLGLLVETK